MRGYRVSTCAVAVVAAALLLVGSGASAYVPTPVSTWVVSGGGLGNGTVEAVAVSGQTAYIGGNFGYIGPASGATASFATSNGAMSSPWPSISGLVYAVAPDGNNGWFVGGSFSTIGTVHYDNLVHIKSDGTVDTNWKGGTNGTVFSLVVSGARLFAGGAFTTVHDANPSVSRSSLAAFAASDGTVQNFNVAVTGTNPFVWTMALNATGNNLYIGGRFGSVGGQTKGNLAAVTALAGTGTLLGFNPNVDGTVRAVAVSFDGTIYAGGEFTTVNVGGLRPRLATASRRSTAAASSTTTGTRARMPARASTRLPWSG